MLLSRLTVGSMEDSSSVGDIVDDLEPLCNNYMGNTAAHKISPHDGPG